MVVLRVDYIAGQHRVKNKRRKIDSDQRQDVHLEFSVLRYFADRWILEYRLECLSYILRLQLLLCPVANRYVSSLDLPVLCADFKTPIRAQTGARAPSQRIADDFRVERAQARRLQIATYDSLLGSL